jgi:hypothetical protein
MMSYHRPSELSLIYFINNLFILYRLSEARFANTASIFYYLVSMSFCIHEKLKVFWNSQIFDFKLLNTQFVQED